MKKLGRKLTSPELDEKLYEYASDAIEKKIKLSSRMLKTKAKAI